MGDFEDIEFGLIHEERYDDVIDHLRNNFFADEPLNHAVSLCRPGEPHAELEEHSLTTLKDGLSQMAVNTDTGQVRYCHYNEMRFPQLNNCTNCAGGPREQNSSVSNTDRLHPHV